MSTLDYLPNDIDKIDYLSSDEEYYLSETVGQMPDSHLGWLQKQAASVESWTELGVYCGRSALAVGLALPFGGLLQLVDIRFQQRFYPSLEWLLRHRPGLRVTLCQTTSVEAAKFLPNTDVVFVDDNHSYESVYASVLAWQDKCKILCGHDYDSNEEPYPPHAGVKRAVDELCKSVTPIQSNGEFNGIWLREE